MIGPHVIPLAHRFCRHAETIRDAAERVSFAHTIAHQPAFGFLGGCGGNDQLFSDVERRMAVNIICFGDRLWSHMIFFRIEAGGTLTSIAKKYHVNPVAISEANNIVRHAALDVGEKLIIPAAPPKESKSRLVRYRVRKGDTLGGIADRFSVPAESVRKWNHMRTNHVRRGMVLRIYTVGGAPEIAPVRRRPKTRSRAHVPRASAAAGQTSAAIRN